MADTDLPWASKPIEIHCDMGEAFGNWTMGDDEAIMPHITSCSVACGFHAGDPMVMYKTVKAARRHGIRIGAHPSYLDLQGFALYGVMCKDKMVCEAVCRAAKHFTSSDGTTPVPMIGAAGTLMETTCAAMGIPFVQEIIADLEYDEHGDCIISRTHDAVDLDALRTRVREALQTGRIACKNGGKRRVDLKLGAAPLSLCIHSDTPGAVEVAVEVSRVVGELNRQRFGVEEGQV
ncbi:Lactam utilization protein lamB [Beauveria bassiana]|uniref:Lactam utilization protein lamB n=1 Tax=Beauveria bassiana TaxID=176275 RepID=A0A2N6NJZ6_BEABA|nr:Lactam utilization protein lamB [Beauveria bassiana]